MTDRPGDPDREGEFASWLAACDDALAAGAATLPLEFEQAPADLRPRLERQVAWCRLVRQLWPRGDTLGGSALPSSGRSPVEEDTGAGEPPPQFGRFQIRRELGRGAYGVVFLAYDPQLRRDVALKVPRPEALLTRELRARFRHEAQAAAGLDHPNLVPVFDSGEEGSVCYIASAYCPGITLAAWLKRRERPVPIRTAARLVATVAAAVEHAHQKGVLHRDLKPSNVMLTSPPCPEAALDDLDLIPRVTDFGLAKLLDWGPDAAHSVDQTQSGAILGTPAYMAPEQASGQSRGVGPPADVYALGAILYEVLIGRALFQAETPVDTLLLVRTESPVSPGRLRAGIPRDLETICLKCLEKEPHRRYPTAGGLAEDLERFLAGQPIQARPTPAWERAWKWARRHPAVATLAGVGSLAVLGVVVVVMQSNVRLRRERNYSESQRRLAVANLRKAQEAVDRMLTQVGVERLRDLPQVEPVVRGLLEDALSFYRDLAAQAGDDPEVRLEMGRAYRRLGEHYMPYRRQDRVAECYRQALAIHERLVSESPQRPSYRRELAATLINLAQLLNDDDRTREANEALTRARELLERLAAEAPDDPGYLLDLARAYTVTGVVRSSEGRRREEEAAARKALSLMKEAGTRSPLGPDVQVKMSVIRNNLGVVIEEDGRLDQAEAVYWENLDVLEGLAKRWPSVNDYRSKLALNLDNLGFLLAKTGRAPEAEKTLRRVIDLRRELMEAYPQSPFYPVRIANTLRGLADLVSKRGDHTTARALLDQAIGLRRTAIRLAPGDSGCLESMRLDLLALSELLIGLRDHAAAARTITELPDVDPKSPKEPLEAASFLARCLRVVEGDRALTDVRREELACDYASRAVDHIRTALRRGFRDAVSLEKDTRFEPLRPRAEFRELLREMR
jgi:tetratricopeptide (TPR) repeat protein